MIPSIGEVIDTDKAIILCRQHKLDFLADRIANSPEQYKDWVFDGASMVPDELFSRLFGIPNLIEIALRHDLRYAYGSLDEAKDEEKREADELFLHELLNDGTSPIIAKLMYEAVVAFGDGPVKTDFTWGFANKDA